MAFKNFKQENNLRNKSVAVVIAAILLGTSAGLAQAASLEEKIDLLANEVDQIKQGVAGQRGGGHNGSSARTGETLIGGYGELHYNNLNGSKEIDFHRFVLFFGKNFSDRMRFRSEFELEHALAGEGKPGEIELEQAYVEFDLNNNTQLKGGLFLVPVGMLNETHEPPTFYGTERNSVEKNIIPTTWWEGGAALTSELAPGVNYDLAVHSGLNTTAANSYSIRDGRQKVAEAVANNLAFTGRIRWSAVPGLQLAAAVNYQTDVTQGTDATAGSATLLEADASYKRGKFGLKALYANWVLQGAGPAAIGADKQTGYYVEPSYRISPKLGVFARYGNWNNAAGTAGGAATTRNDIGFNYWPSEDVVVKVDYQDQTGSANDGFNIGIGYQY